jgi:hypothetical protein
MKNKRLLAVVLVAFLYVAVCLLTSVAFGATFREGVFQINVPSSLSSLKFLKPHYSSRYFAMIMPRAIAMLTTYERLSSH